MAEITEITENTETVDPIVDPIVDPDIDEDELGPDEELDIDEDEDDDDEEEELDIDEDEKRYCNGSFRMLTGKEFTQNEDYSDDYLKSKGLFKDVEVEGE